MNYPINIHIFDEGEADWRQIGTLNGLPFVGAKLALANYPYMLTVTSVVFVADSGEITGVDIYTAVIN